MNQLDQPIPISDVSKSTIAVPTPKRPLGRRIMHVVRRGHLYVGLFLFPWALLYGVTGFLFNHPTFFADAPTVNFSRADLVGTPLEHLPTPDEQAKTILDTLNKQEGMAKPFEIGTGEAHYATRETFVATVKADTRTFFVVYDPKTGSGTIRETTTRTVTEKAPFATGSGEPPRQRGMGMGGPMKHNHAGLKVEDSVTDRIKAAVPTIMTKHGFPTGDVTITSAPDIKFPIMADGNLWTAMYNPITTNISGTKGPEQPDLSIRTFMLRMHLSRGYPGEVTTKWFWAIGVDAIAIVLCFWAISGLFMWWQIKATRKPGLIVLTLSAIAATVLASNMFTLLAA